MDEAEKDALVGRAKADVLAELHHRARVVGAIVLGALGGLLLLPSFFAGAAPGVILGLALSCIAMFVWPPRLRSGSGT